MEEQPIVINPEAFANTSEAVANMMNDIISETAVVYQFALESRLPADMVETMAMLYYQRALAAAFSIGG